MTRIILISAAVIIGAASTAPAATADRVVVVKKRSIAANGRCRGISYGTGARRCDTLSGGPSGGISSRN